MTHIASTGGRAARLGRLAAGALALLGLSAPPVDARTLSPEQAPAAWVAYAQDATRAITQWLNADDPPAPKLRASLDAVRPAPDRPVPALVVKVWVGSDGALTRVDTFPPASPTTTQDLRTLLVGRHLAPPPRRMRQPMRLALDLTPRPAPEGRTVLQDDASLRIADAGGASG
jgi:hypothetical protein